MKPLPSLLRFLLFAAAIALSLQTANASDRAAWMREAKWGVMTHFLADWIARETKAPMSVERWNQLVDGFQVEALADQLHQIGAGYYLISIGQNSGYYLSPNSHYDRIVGYSPSRLSRRDLVADLGTALEKRGIRLMVYLPSGAPAGDAQARQALSWQNGPHRNAEFQRHWEAIIREWSTRWGSSVSGWWFDGCYWPNTLYRTAEAPNFSSFAAAARAGNPASALAFCPGVLYRTVSITPEEDYLAGEVDRIEAWQPRRVYDGKADGAQIHVLSFLGERWGMGQPRLPTAQAAEFTAQVIKTGGAMTWDAPVQLDGTLGPAFVEQFRAIAASAKAASFVPPSPAR